MSLTRPSAPLDAPRKRKSQRVISSPSRRPDEIDRQNAEMAALKRMMELSAGTFSLSLAVCNSPALRDHVISALQRDAPRIQRVAVPPGTTDVFGYVAAQPLPADSEALFIIGLEN